MSVAEQLVIRSASCNSSERVESLVGFLRVRCGSLTGIPPAIAVPPELQQLYSSAGETLTETVCVQNYLTPPEALRISDGMIPIADENQGVYRWAIEATTDSDPIVFGRFEETDPWVDLDQPLSSFLTQFVLLETLFSSPWGASASHLDPQRMESLAGELRPYPSPVWRWPSLGARLFVRGDAIAFSCPNGRSPNAPDPSDPHSFWIGARSPAALEFLRPFVSVDWDHVQIDA